MNYFERRVFQSKLYGLVLWPTLVLAQGDIPDISKFRSVLYHAHRPVLLRHFLQVSMFHVIRPVFERRML